MKSSLPSPELEPARIHHPDCVVCSPDCEHGLRISFSLDHNDHAVGSFDCAERFRGYPGLLHGGVVSALLDAAMTHWLFLHQRAAVTAELNVRFRHPVNLNQPAQLRAWCTETRDPVFRLEAQLIQEDQCKAHAKAVFMQRRQSAHNSSAT